MERLLSNKKLNPPYILAESSSYLILTEPSWTPEEYLQALQKIQLEDVVTHSKVLFTQICVKTLCHGNLKKEVKIVIGNYLICKKDATSHFSSIFENFKKIPKPTTPIIRPLAVTIPTKKYHTKFAQSSEVNSANKYHLQV